MQIVNVKTQKGASDCGLFSLAFATSLCVGANPAQENYIQNELRSHLYKCLEQKNYSISDKKK